MDLLSRQNLLQTFEKKICELHNYFSILFLFHAYLSHVYKTHFWNNKLRNVNIDVKIYDVVYEHIYGLKFS